MHKRKLVSIVLILFALLLPPLIVAVSSSTNPIGGALLLQAINTANSRTTTSDLNQQHIQITNITTQNINCTEFQQKEISAKTADLYDAWLEYYVDNDYDGYYELITLGWDADTDETSEVVLVEVYYRDEYDNVGFVGDSGWYTIYGGDPPTEDEYMDIVCYDTGLYDFSLVLYDEYYTEVYTIDFGYAGITDIPMEPLTNPYYSLLLMMAVLLPTILNAQSTPIVPLIAIATIAIIGAILGAVYYKMRPGGGKPKPPTSRGKGPKPYVPPKSLAKPVGAITCPQCGHANVPYANFCERCGTELESP